MPQEINLTLNKQPYGNGVHLYKSGIIHEGWWIVPVDWGAESYTVSCFDLRGARYHNWHHYPSIEKAIAAGAKLVKSQISKSSPNGD